MSDFSVLAAMYEEPPYDCLACMRFIATGFGGKTEGIFELDVETYRGFVVSGKKFELTLKNKRGSSKLVEWLKIMRPTVEIAFVNFHRNAATIKFKVETVDYEQNMEVIKIILGSRKEIQIEYEKESDLYSYVTKVFPIEEPHDGPIPEG